MEGPAGGAWRSQVWYPGAPDPRAHTRGLKWQVPQKVRACPWDGTGVHSQHQAAPLGGGCGRLTACASQTPPAGRERRPSARRWFPSLCPTIPDCVIPGKVHTLVGGGSLGPSCTRPSAWQPVGAVCQHREWRWSSRGDRGEAGAARTGPQAGPPSCVGGPAQSCRVQRWGGEKAGAHLTR